MFFGGDRGSLDHCRAPRAVPDWDVFWGDRGSPDHCRAPRAVPDGMFVLGGTGVSVSKSLVHGMFLVGRGSLS